MTSAGWDALLTGRSLFIYGKGTMGTDLVKQEQQLPSPEIQEKLLVRGDLSTLTPEQKVNYYVHLCHSLGLNPLTRPFQFLIIGNPPKTVLYTSKDATEQLRKNYNISLRIVSKEQLEGGVYEVTVEAKDYSGRTDQASGTVSTVKEEVKKEKDGTTTTVNVPIVGTELAKLRMIAETKAKRRATLSICGLGALDESELDTVRNARQIPWREALQLKDGNTAKAEEISEVVDLASRRGITTNDLKQMANVDHLSELTDDQLGMLRVMVQMREPPAEAVTGG